MSESRLILNVGCGTGSKREGTFREYAYRAIGKPDVNLDLNCPRIHIPNFVRADAQHLPFREEVFAEIYASHIIEHLPRFDLFLQECHSVLVKHGILVVWTPNMFSEFARNDRTHVQFFTVGSLMRAISHQRFFPVWRNPFCFCSRLFRSHLLCKLLGFLFLSEICVEARKVDLPDETAFSSLTKLLFGY